jgi:exonuclease III
MSDDTKELAELRKRIKVASVPASSKNNFRLLTWNLRQFGRKKSERGIKFMAEVMKNFDLVAVQECKGALDAVEKLQENLGASYRVLFSDCSGNDERLAFIYNRKKVEFTGLAAEVVMCPGQGREGVAPELEFDRSPYMASFRVNGCNFIVVTVHIYYGSGSAVKYRLGEIRNVAKYLKKASSDTDTLDTDYIACGDFNIEDVRQVMVADGESKPLRQLFNALCEEGLIVPDDIQKSPSNLTKDKHYDQIGFQQYKDSTLKYQKGGVIDFVGAVFPALPLAKLKDEMSDHLPMWACFEVSPDKDPKKINI